MEFDRPTRWDALPKRRFSHASQCESPPTQSRSRKDQAAFHVCLWTARGLRPVAVRLSIALGFVLSLLAWGAMWTPGSNSGLSMDLMGLYFADSGGQYWLDIHVDGGPSSFSTWIYTVEVRVHQNWPMPLPGTTGQVKHDVIGYDARTRQLFYRDAQTGVRGSIVGQWTSPLIDEQPVQLLRWDSDGSGFTFIGSTVHRDLPDIRSDQRSFLWRPFLAWLGRRAWWGVLLFALAWLAYRCAASALNDLGLRLQLGAQCGYDLVCNSTGVCPECGTPIMEPTVKQSPRGR